MIIMADTSLLIKLVEAKGYEVVYQFFDEDNAVMALPTPAIAEFLTTDNNFNRAEFLSKMNSFTQVFDFDMKSAHTSAKLNRELQDVGFLKDQREQNKLRIDVQLVSIALANQIKQIFTADTQIHEIIDVLNLPIEAIDIEKNNEYFDLPLFQNL